MNVSIQKQHISYQYWANFIACVLVVHGFLLLNDGSYWDGWLADYLISNGHFEEAKNWFYSAGLHPQIWLYKAAHFFTNYVLAYKIIAFLSLLVIGIVIVSLAYKHTNLTKNESFILGAIAISFPGNNILISSIFILHITSMAVFFIGWYLLFNCINSDVVTKKYYTAIIFILISFFHSSLLVFHYAFLLSFSLVYAKRSGYSGLNSLHGIVYAFFSKYWLLFVIPVIFFIVKHVVFESSGLYEGYNSLIINWDMTANEKIERIWYRLSQFKNNAILYQFIKAYEIIKAHYITAISVLIVIIILLLRKEASNENNSTQIENIMFLVVGLISLALAMFPYLAVGKGPWSYFGWGTRFELQMGLPIALIILGAIKITSNILSKYFQYAQLAGHILFAFIFISFFAVLTDNYLLWQARWAKDLSVMSLLQKSEKLPEGTVIIWEDDFVVGNQEYASYELSVLLSTAWGKEAWLPIWRSDKNEKLHSVSHYTEGIFGGQLTTYKTSYAYSDFNQNNCIAQLSIKKKHSEVSDYDVALNYIFLKYSNSSLLNSYLKDLTILEIYNYRCEHKQADAGL